MKINGIEINKPAFGNMSLKDNTIESVISSIGERVRITGTSLPGELSNFTYSSTDQVLQYTGANSGVFHCVCTLSLQVGGNNVMLGAYLAINTSGPRGTLDPDTDRITESEVYTIAGFERNEAISIQFIRTLNPGDRIYPIVQNNNSRNNITVEFFNFVVHNVSNIAVQGFPQPLGDAEITPPDETTTDAEITSPDETTTQRPR